MYKWGEESYTRGGRTVSRLSSKSKLTWPTHAGWVMQGDPFIVHRYHIYLSRG